MYIDDHILYHGTVLSVPEPLTHVGRPDLDFGPGFYVTNDRDQAIKWANTKAAQFQDPKYGLQLMSDTYIVNDIKAELAKFGYEQTRAVEQIARASWATFVAFQ